MRTNGIAVLGILGIGLAAASCGGYRSPILPGEKEYRGVVASTSGFISVNGRTVKAMFVYQNEKMREGLPGADQAGIAAEDASIPIVGLAAVVTDEDYFFFNDVPHGQELSQALKDQKLNLSDFKMKPRCGTIDRDLRFSPTRDVLCPLDTGYQLVLANDRIQETLTIQPLYDSRLYRPYQRDGVSRPASAAGPGFGMASYDMSLTGASGASGGSGNPGGRGAHGKPGQNARTLGTSGGNGGDGGNGGSGSDGQAGQSAYHAGGHGSDGRNGSHGGSGGDGARGGSGTRGEDGNPGHRGVRGEDGPSLKVVVRPIYSKFYPDEELVFVQVDAAWHSDTRNGAAYKTETLNYIFHAGDRFTFVSQGGRGGDGGQGGRGGNGGNGGGGGSGGSGGRGGRGGNGGHGGPGNAQQHIQAGQPGRGGNGGDGGDGGSGSSGGNGASNGIGGRGGDGADGGDGGQISVVFQGPAAFREGARAALAFRSVPGEGGSGALPGDNGIAGSAGSGGSGGRGGSGGDGGAGSPMGKRGSDGQGGSAGRMGQPGQPNLARNPRGNNGRRGSEILVQVADESL